MTETFPNQSEKDPVTEVGESVVKAVEAINKVKAVVGQYPEVIRDGNVLAEDLISAIDDLRPWLITEQGK